MEKSTKIIFLGDSQVGKTSIINSFINQEYDPSIITSVGNSYIKKEFNLGNDKKILYEIWDTVGQERYRGIIRSYYKNTKIGVLVYDITSPQSFESIKNYWYNELSQNSPKDISI